MQVRGEARMVATGEDRAGYDRGSPARLRLRPLGEGDQPAFAAAQRELAEHDGFPFGFGYHDGVDWAAYRAQLEAQRCGEGLPPGWVASTFLVASVDGELVGRTSIRHELTNELRVEGGHIGFAVRPQHRRRGYATEILRQSLVVARAVGVERALLTCADDNAASAAVIERCGGVLDAVATTADGRRIRRYWID